MQETISLIASDTYGNPEPDSPLGHYVRVTSRTNPTRINQLTDGGNFPHADCADACIRSLLIDLTGTAPTTTIVEVDSETTATGTQVDEVADALNRLLPDGYSATVVSGTPTRDTVMNPLGGRTVPPLQWAPYGHASRGVFIDVVGPPAQPPTPVASSITEEADDMLMFAVPNGTVYLELGGKLVAVSDGPQEQRFTAAGVKTVECDEVMYERLLGLVIQPPTT